MRPDEHRGKRIWVWVGHRWVRARISHVGLRVFEDPAEAHYPKPGRKPQPGGFEA